MLLCNDQRKRIILDSLNYMVIKKRVEIHSFVIMPNHVHVTLNLLNEEKEETFQRDFLKFTSQQLIKKLIQENNQAELDEYKSSQKDRIYHIWERRAKWIEIDNLAILEQKIEYIHNNPVQEKWKLVDLPEEYIWSSASFYLLNDKRYGFIKHYMD